MAERNLEEAASVVTKEFLETAINNTESGKKATVQDFTVNWLGKIGDNSSAFALRIKAKVRCDGDAEVERNFVLKTAQNNEMFNDVIRKSGGPLKEVSTYKELIPALVQLQKDRGVEPILPSAAKMYYGREEPYLLLLEDLGSQGYTIIDESKGADLSQTKAVLQELAAWHALSLVLKNGDVDGLKAKHGFPFVVPQFGPTFEGMMAKSFAAGVQKLVSTTQGSSSASEDVKSRAAKLLELDAYQTVRDALKPVEPFSMFCHADVHCKNAMVKYEEADGKKVPTSVKFIDFQRVRYARPTTDLVFFLLLNTSRSLRKDHTHDLLKLYHAKFMDVLRHVKYELPEFTLAALEDMYKDTVLYGVVMGCMALPFKLGNRKEIENLEKIKKESKTMEEFGANNVNNLEKADWQKTNDEIVEEALIGLVEDAVEWGLI